MESVLTWLGPRPFALGLGIAVCVYLIILPFAFVLGRGWEQPILHSVFYGAGFGLASYLKDRKRRSSAK
jgi:hypothetical protein